MREIIALFDPETLGALGIVGTLVLIGYILWRMRGFFAAIARGVHRVHDFLDDWNGEPARPGKDAEPGVMERLQVLEDKQDEQGDLIDDMHHELKPNGGSSMNDRLTRVEKRLNPHAPDNK